jgi:hypothetical protein
MLNELLYSGGILISGFGVYVGLYKLGMKTARYEQEQKIKAKIIEMEKLNDDNTEYVNKLYNHLEKLKKF